MNTVNSEIWDSALLPLRDPWGSSDSHWKTPWQAAHQSASLARILLAWETLQAQPAASVDSAEPYSLPWFLGIERQRHGKLGRWIPKILEFTRHRGETLLGIGDGLGTDWVQYAQNGATVVVCSESGPQLSVIRRNFEVRNLSGRFMHAHPRQLPLDSDSIDVVCLSALHQPLESPEQVIAEVYRVLKPGGKVLAVTPAFYDIAYWTRICFFWQSWLADKQPPPQVEPRFSGRSLRGLFGRFVEHRLYKRQLRRSEVPHLWRWIPTSWLARLVGTALVLKAFKPLPLAKGME
jgi:SAM-dependent methyltransferase